eukprot:gene13824-19741_t
MRASLQVTRLDCKARASPPRSLPKLRLVVVACAAQDAALETKRLDYIKGCTTVLSELKGLDFGRDEARMYFKAADKVPKGAPKACGLDFDLTRSRAALYAMLGDEELSESSVGSPLFDMEALKVSQLMLADIWRWRRKGGGLEDNDEERPHKLALEQIQNFKPEDIERVTSTILDGLDMTEADKRELGGAVQKVAIGGIQGAVWGSLVLAILGLLLFNFLRSA